MKFDVELKLTEQGRKISTIQKDLKNLSKEANNASNSNKKLSGSFKTVVAGAAAAGVAFYAIVKAAGLYKDSIVSIVKTSAEIERMSSILKTLKGSTEEAEKSMAWITKFAETTPFQLNKVTEAYIKMNSYGLDESGLRSYGDTASAMGKDVIQVVEAVADAMNGENERLKELGIKAAVQGEKTMYTWKNAHGKAMYKIVENNAKIKESTLQAIFNSKFKGAMKEQERSFNTLYSNMIGKFKQIQVSVGKTSGIFGTVKKVIKGVSDALAKLFNDKEKMVELSKYVKDSFISLIKFSTGTIEAFIRVKSAIYVFYTAINETMRRVSLTLMNTYYKTEKFVLKMKFAFENMFSDKKFKDTDVSFGLEQKIATNERIITASIIDMKKKIIAEKKSMNNSIDKLDFAEKYVLKIAKSEGGPEKKDEKPNVQKPKVAGAVEGSYTEGIKALKKLSKAQTSTGKKSIEQINREKNEAMNAINKKLNAQLNYYTTVKDYEKAQSLEVEIYRNQIANEDYSDLQRKELMIAKQEELKQKYKEIALQEKNSGKDLDAGFSRYMTNLENRINDYSKVSESIMASTENILSNSINSIFEQLKVGTLSFKNIMKDSLKAIMNMIQQLIVKMLAMKAMQAASSYFTVGTSMFANGAAFQNGNVTKFANGGVVNKPTVFAMKNGRQGLMGEAGPEAIMPLARDLRGRLGVRANIEGSGGQNVAPNIIINNYSGQQVTTTTNEKGDTVVTVGMVEQIDQMLAVRFNNGQSETDKIINKKYSMNKN